MRKFSVQLKSLTNNLTESLRQIPLEAAEELATNIKRDTPFLTGRAAAHWQIRSDQNFVYNPKKTGSTTDPVEVSAEATSGGMIYIGNAAPYSTILEEQGSKFTTPHQMVQMNMDFWEQIVESVSERLGFK